MGKKYKSNIILLQVLPWSKPHVLPKTEALQKLAPVLLFSLLLTTSPLAYYGLGALVFLSEHCILICFGVSIRSRCISHSLL